MSQSIIIIGKSLKLLKINEPEPGLSVDREEHAATEARRSTDAFGARGLIYEYLVIWLGS
jgi:hypothetical protein